MRLFPLFVIGLCAAAGGVSCVKQKSAGSSRLAQAEANKDPLLCPNGLVMDFMLLKTSTVPAASSIDWPKHADKPDRNIVSASTSENIRLKSCMEEDYSLRKLIGADVKFGYDDSKYSQKGEAAIRFTQSDIGETSVVEGLKEAVFGDYSKLRLEISKKDYALFIRGWDNGGHPVVTAEMEFPYYEGETPTPYSWYRSHTIVGTLESGNPFEGHDDRCGVESYTQRRYPLGPTAIIETEQCEGPVIADAENWRFLKVHVQDKNPMLAAPIDRTFEGVELAKVLNVRFYHHGGNTYFILTLPEVQYAMRRIGAGAGASENDMPEIVHGEDKAGKGIIIYSGKPAIIEDLKYMDWTSRNYQYKP